MLMNGHTKKECLLISSGSSRAQRSILSVRIFVFNGGSMISNINIYIYVLFHGSRSILRGYICVCLFACLSLRVLVWPTCLLQFYDLNNWIKTFSIGNRLILRVNLFVNPFAKILIFNNLRWLTGEMGQNIIIFLYL